MVRPDPGAALRAVAGGAAGLGLFGAGLGPSGRVSGAKKNKKKKGQCRNDGNCKQPTNPCQEAVCKNRKCRPQDLPDGTDCGEDSACVDGQCLPDCAGDVCVVTPNRTLNWVVNSPGIQFVEGPDDPPLGNGSLEFSTENVTRARLENHTFDGIGIDALLSLAYSTYQQTAGTVVPAIKLPVLTNASETSQFTELVFEPIYYQNQALQQNTWQSWDALSADARWWTERPIPDICAVDCFVPRQDILDSIPDATIFDAFLVELGHGTPDQVGNVDAVEINGITYDFELNR